VAQPCPAVGSLEPSVPSPGWPRPLLTEAGLQPPTGTSPPTPRAEVFLQQLKHQLIVYSVILLKKTALKQEWAILVMAATEG